MLCYLADIQKLNFGWKFEISHLLSGVRIDSQLIPDMMKVHLKSYTQRLTETSS